MVSFRRFSRVVVLQAFTRMVFYMERVHISVVNAFLSRKSPFRGRVRARGCVFRAQGSLSINLSLFSLLVREKERKIFKGEHWWEKITPRRRRALREARLYVTKRRRLRALLPFDVVFIIDSSRKESTKHSLLLIICSPPFFPYLFLHRLSKMPPKRRCAIASPRSAPRRKSPMR